MRVACYHRTVAERYKPNASLDGRSVAIFVGATVMAAAVAALGAHFVARKLTLVLVLPAVQGLVVGGAAIWAIRNARLQRPGTFGAVAAVAAASAVIGHGVLDYRNERAAHHEKCAARRDYSAVAGVTNAGGLDRDYQLCLAELTPRGFLARRFGIDGVPRGAGRSGLAVGALELLLAMGVAGLLAASTAREPACPTCRHWRVESALGVAALGVSEQLVARLLAGQTAAAAGLLEPPDTREEIEVGLLACPEGHDLGGGVLRVTETRLDRRRRLGRRRVADLMVTRQEAEAIRERLA